MELCEPQHLYSHLCVTVFKFYRFMLITCNEIHSSHEMKLLISYTPRDPVRPRYVQPIQNKPEVHDRIHKIFHWSLSFSPVRICTVVSATINFNIILRHTTTYFLQAFQSNFCMHFIFPDMCYMSQTIQPFWFDHPGNISRGVQILKLLTMYVSLLLRFC
jgi:hypothetical protein